MVLQESGEKHETLDAALHGPYEPPSPGAQNSAALSVATSEERDMGQQEASLSGGNQAPSHPDGRAPPPCGAFPHVSCSRHVGLLLYKGPSSPLSSQGLPPAESSPQEAGMECVSSVRTKVATAVLSWPSFSPRPPHALRLGIQVLQAHLWV